MVAGYVNAEKVRIKGFETSLLSCSIGVWTGAVFTKMFLTTLKPVLTPTYFAIVGIGLVAAIIGIYLILPMVDKLTRAEANQTE